MFFIAITLLLTFYSYLYERENIHNRNDLYAFLYYHGMTSALVSVVACGILSAFALLYTSATGEPPLPKWVFVPFSDEE